MKRQYLTVNEKVDLLLENMYQEVMYAYDQTITEEEAASEDYFDNAREFKFDIEGYKDINMNMIYEMSNEEIIKVYNAFFNETETLKEIEELKLYWEGLKVKLAFAEYERGMIVERTQTGKAIARQNPNYKEGRPKKFSKIQMEHAMQLLNDEGKSYNEVAAITGISKSTLIRNKRLS